MEKTLYKLQKGWVYNMKDAKISDKTIALESMYMKNIYAEMAANGKSKYVYKALLNTGDTVTIKVKISKE